MVMIFSFFLFSRMNNHLSMFVAHTICPEKDGFVCHSIKPIIPNANRNARVSQKAKTVPPMFVRLLCVR